MTQVFRKPGASSDAIAMAYDALGRVVSASFMVGGNAVTEAYAYDDEGLRIRTASTSGTVRYSIYNEVRQLVSQFERVGAGALTWKKDMVYVGNREVGETASSGQTTALFSDHLGTPRYQWDGASRPAQQKFLPFGEALADPQAMAAMGKGFTGHEQTDPSGLIYMQARFYLPMYGRFASPDPARDQHFEETQSWNIYSYCMNNPVMNTDPTGEILVSSADDSKKLLPILNKLAMGASVAYDAKTSRYSISGDLSGAGAKLVSLVIGNEHETRMEIGSRNVETEAGNGNSLVTVTGSSVDMAVGNRGQTADSMMLTGKKGDITTEAAPAEIVAGHELIHSLQTMNGDNGGTQEVRPKTRDSKETGTDGNGNNTREYRTVGLKGTGGKSYNKPGDITENALRRERKMRERVSYETETKK